MWLKVSLGEGTAAWQIQPVNPSLWGSKVTKSEKCCTRQSNDQAIKLSSQLTAGQQLHLKSESLPKGLIPNATQQTFFPSSNLQFFFYFYEHLLSYSSASLTSHPNVYMPSRAFV